MKMLALCLMPLVVVVMLTWPANIGYLVYLGITDSWISDKFFQWELISLGLFVPWALITSVSIPWLADKPWRNA